MRIVAIALELPHEGHETPGPEPAQDGHVHRRRLLALDRNRGHRPRIGRKDEAAVPARAPPAVHVSERQHPVAKACRDVGPVGPPRLAVLGRAHDRCREPIGESPTESVQGQRGLQVLARRVRKAAYHDRVHAQRKLSGEPGIVETLLPQQAVAHTNEGRGLAVGQAAGLRSIEIPRDIGPGQRP
jgi:hypothetical protein